MSISNLIFTACVACKNQVRNRQKIKFKNQFREIEILKNQVQIDKGPIGQIFSMLRVNVFDAKSNILKKNQGDTYFVTFVVKDFFIRLAYFQINEMKYILETC